MNDQTPGAADIPKPLAPGEDRSLQGFAGCSQSGFSSMGAGSSNDVAGTGVWARKGSRAYSFLSCWVWGFRFAICLKLWKSEAFRRLLIQESICRTEQECFVTVLARNLPQALNSEAQAETLNPEL